MAPPVHRSTSKVAQGQRSRIPTDPRDEFSKEYGFAVPKPPIQVAEKPLVGENLNRVLKHRETEG